jgi:phosphorylcholine metabolism protein LicD
MGAIKYGATKFVAPPAKPAASHSAPVATAKSPPGLACAQWTAAAVASLILVMLFSVNAPVSWSDVIVNVTGTLPNGDALENNIDDPTHGDAANVQYLGESDPSRYRGTPAPAVPATGGPERMRDVLQDGESPAAVDSPPVVAEDTTDSDTTTNADEARLAELEVFERRRITAEDYTSRPLYPRSVAEYKHPFGDCTGYRSMADFDFQEAYLQEGIRTTGQEPRGFPTLSHMRRLYTDHIGLERGKKSNAMGLYRGLVTDAPLTDPIFQRAARPAVLKRAPANVTVDDGLVVLNREDTVVGANETRLWEHVIPDERETQKTEHESCHYVMARMLAIFAAVCEKYGLNSWFITHGTLLGAVRHGGFIPWDVDVDIVMSRSHMTTLRKVWRLEFPRDMFLQTEKTEPSFHMFIGSEFGMRVSDRYSSFMDVKFESKYKGKIYKQKAFHVGVQLDIIPLQKKVRGAIHHIFHTYFNRSDIYPPSAICFENILVQAPRYPKMYLEKIYGPNYMDIDPSMAMYPPKVSNPCLAANAHGKSNWRLNWRDDNRATGLATVPKNSTRAPAGGPPVLTPRGDPGGNFYNDYKYPFGTWK